MYVIVYVALVNIRLTLKAVIAVSIEPHLTKPCGDSLDLIAKTLALEALLGIVVRWRAKFNQERCYVYRKWDNQHTE
jgi:hypothetical protein